MKFSLELISCFLLIVGLTSGAESSIYPQKSVTPGVYYIDSNGAYAPVTNISAMWPGVWVEGTNGWRVQLCCWNTNSQDCGVSIEIGNVKTNIGRGYYWTPKERFLKCDLIDSNGTAISQIPGIVLSEKFPARLPLHDFGAWPDGRLKGRIGFMTNSPPWVLKQFQFQDKYLLKYEGDYTLAVCVVLYKSGTNNVANRIDLPCVSTKIHLRPRLSAR